MNRENCPRTDDSHARAFDDALRRREQTFRAGRGGRDRLHGDGHHNITRGQIISPPVVAAHNKHHPPLFMRGKAASSDLAVVAEDANNPPPIASLSVDPTVKDVQTVPGPIMPGHYSSMKVRSSGNFTKLTIIGMLVTTNDAFFALNGVDLPTSDPVAHYSPAYDAGSEANNELYANIPGPPCDTPFVRQTAGAEGFVHIHAGIQGVGDLMPATFDWRNPIARITIRRLKKKELP
jgi:hypothetical protein